MLRTTARTSCGSTAARSFRKRASGDAALASAGDELMPAPPSGPSTDQRARHRSDRPARSEVSRYPAGLLLAKLFIAASDEAANAAPQETGAKAKGGAAAQPESGAEQTGLHPGGGQITEAIKHRVDDVLGLVATRLGHHGKADLPTWRGDGVLRDASHDLHH